MRIASDQNCSELFGLRMGRRRQPIEKIGSSGWIRAERAERSEEREA